MVCRVVKIAALLVVFALPACEPGSRVEGVSPGASSVDQLAVTGVGRQGLEGLWAFVQNTRPDWSSADEAPMTAEGQALVDSYVQEEDPAMDCIFPFGRVLTVPFPVEILMGEDRVTFLYEYDHEVRRIYMDGRGHPVDLYPTLMGHSIGRWEGNALVVETVGLEGGTFRNAGQLPYSDSVHVSERYTLQNDGGQVLVELTVNDPLYYAAPWIATWRFGPASEILEYRCVVREHLQAEDKPQ